jgi:hypothetical protein
LTILSLVVAAVFGSSGVTTFVLTYAQIRNERKKRGLQYFRQIVLTPDFVHYLGILFSLVSAFSEVPKTRDDVGDVQRDVGELNKYKNLIQGAMLFLPYKVLNALNEADNAVSTMVELLLDGNLTAIPGAQKDASSCLSQLGLELKKVLGIDVETS